VFDMGKADGVYKFWYDNGHLKEEQSYKKGIKNGKWTWWYKHDHNLNFTDGNWSYNGTSYNAEDGEELWKWWWYLNDNKEKEGYFTDGKRNGLWTWWYDTGYKKSEGSYLDDEQDGLWLYYNPDESIGEEITFLGGQKDGRSTTWLTPEEKSEEKFYRNGKLDGPSTFWENGFRSVMTSYKNDVPNGPWMIWYPSNDQIKEQGFHFDGLRDGLTVYYYKNSVKQREGNYNAGYPEGVWSYWNAKSEKDFDFDFGINLEHIDLKDLSERDKLFYKIGESTTFTGIITQENTEAGYLFLGRTTDGKKDGPWVKWFSEGKKVPEILLSDVPEPQPEIPCSSLFPLQGISG
jgi:antitoxin component YwqK of YwqJK toxin-antitoxin module